MMEELPTIDKTAGLVYYGVNYKTDQEVSTNARTRYSFCSDWKLNLRGTMKGLFTCARTRRSASVCVISLRLTICIFRMVFKAYIRDVSRFLTCITLLHSSKRVNVCSWRTTYLSEASFPDHGNELKLIDCQWLAVGRLIWNADLNFTRPADDVVPLILASHCIEIGYEFNAAHENVVSKIISETISATLGFVGT